MSKIKPILITALVAVAAVAVLAMVLPMYRNVLATGKTKPPVEE